MQRKVFLLALCMLITGAAAMAQQPTDPLGDAFFPPEFIMQHQQVIALSEEQKSFLKNETRKAQTLFTELQWQLQDEVEKMVSLIKQETIDEQQTLAQLEKVLSVEREIKRAQIALLIRVRNKLSAEQRSRLMEIKSKQR